MGEWKQSALQDAFWSQANSLRCEAKLCDIILYVMGKKGAMVGYPAHKVILISCSRYFKLLFEREDLRNYCHFPHLTEDGLFAVLDFIYGRNISKDTVDNLDDAMMAARFLQVDSAVEELERKKTEFGTTKKRKLENTDHENESQTREKTLYARKRQNSSDNMAFTITTNDNESPVSSHNSEQDSDMFNAENIVVKSEVDDDNVDLTADSDNEQYNDFATPSSSNVQQSPQYHRNISHLSPGESTRVMSNASFPVMVIQHKSLDSTTFREESYAYPITKKIYSCKVCGKQLGSSTGLKTHMMLHTGEKPFACDICGQKFVHKGHLRQHTLGHTGERPYICVQCDRTFLSTAALKQHLQTHGPDAKGNYICGHCRQEFDNRSDLIDHVMELHVYKPT